MAALENYENFGEVTCASGGFSSGATTIALSTGEGSKLPSGLFRLTFWNATDYAKASDDPSKEIIGVAVRSGDNLTSLSRGLEGTSAVNHNTAGKTYKGTLSITKATITAIDSYISDLDKSAFRAYQGSNLTVPTASDTKFSFDTEDYDLSNEFTPWNSGSISTTARFLTQKACLVLVTMSMHIAVTTNGNRYRIRIRKNGTQVSEGRFISFNTGEHRIQHTDQIKMAASEYLEFYVNQEDGVDRTVNSGRENTWVAVAVIGTARKN